MPSQAAARFADAVRRIQLIRDTANDARLRPVSRDKARILLHASLAGYVAAWESYLEQLVRDVFQASADPLDPKFHTVHSLLRDQAEIAWEKFNTPNSENARNLLVQYTGFDPFPAWQWPARHMNGVQVRERLTEILKVRHSFAHGFSMPKYTWNTSPSGDARLTWPIVDMTERFFVNLVNRTDAAMSAHVSAIYGHTL